jgi:hypothetical protein
VIVTFSAATYQQRRSALQQSMPDSLLLFVGNVDSPMNYHDNIFPFVQDSSFRYFFGQNQPGMAALIDTAAGTTTLFGNEPAVADIVWTGPQPTLAERAALPASATASLMPRWSRPWPQPVLPGAPCIIWHPTAARPNWSWAACWVCIRPRWRQGFPLR